jgi:hypothetical protein
MGREMNFLGGIAAASVLGCAALMAFICVSLALGGHWWGVAVVVGAAAALAAYLTVSMRRDGRGS